MLERRIRLIKDIDSGKKRIKQVAKLLKVSRQSVSKWLARYRLEGAAGLLPKKRGPKHARPWNKTKREVERRICELAKENPSQGHEWIAEQLRSAVHPITVYRILKRRKIRSSDVQIRRKGIIDTVTWILPRPREEKYKGGFPLHFEKKLWKELGRPKRVLHPFGGKAEIGERVDMNPEVKPDFVGDAHDMHFLEDDSYDLVLLDPPYDDEQSEKLYGTGSLSYQRYVTEAVRVCEPGGYVAIYHWVMTPRPEGTKFYKRILILTRTWHRPRVCCVFKKE